MKQEELEAGALTVSGAARALRVSEGTVRAWERRGELPATKLASGMRLFRRADVERLIRARKARGGEAE